MTKSEAIYCLKVMSEYHSEVCEECPLYGETGTDHCYEDALDIAINALEKQITKKPTDVRYFGEAGYYIGLCPVCGQGNNSDYPYCGDCGQKLDWSDK